MRTELVNNRWLLCGCILPVEAIKVGQEWASASGTNHIVRVAGVEEGWVHYAWMQDGDWTFSEKDSFSFQGRYCLVLPSSEIPKELL